LALSTASLTFLNHQHHHQLGEFVVAITYTKLKNGNWGVRSTEAIKSGQTITVRKKSGDTKIETIDKIVWSGDGVWLAAVTMAKAANGARRTSRGQRTGCSCGSIEDTPRKSDCASCRFENEDQ
jgi:hypothetical protein